ncbi:hypothetical protein Tco_0180279 [Tanacetum coccineum]
MLQPTSNTNKILPGSVAELSRRRGQLREQMTNTFITKDYFDYKMKEMSNNLNNLVPELIIAKTNELIKEAIPRMVNDAIIEELFKIHMKNKVLNVHPTTSISTTKITADLKPQLYLKMKSDLHAQATDPEM